MNDRQVGVDQFALHGKVAIVSGGSRGIGRAIALGLAAAGADVVLASRTAAAVESVAQEVGDAGRRSLAVVADISRRADVEALVSTTLQAFDRVDILVNSAGISEYRRAVKLREEDWDQVLAVNLKGAFLCCQAAGRAMIEQRCGKIINITSIGATTGLARRVAYSAAKGGLLQLTRVLANEWAEFNVQVNAIAPGYIETDMTAGLKDNVQLHNEVIQRTPMRRLGRPDELIGAALLLASTASSYITGHMLYVDGGWSAA